MPPIYLCIDLKSFYASVECVARGLDPFRANLVVADASRGKGAICLAVSPALKALGVRNRCRLYEIPDDVDYIAAMPRMRKYMETSAEICALYQQFVSPDDIYVYSIDECFVHISPYLTLYRQTPKEFAQTLMREVQRQTGICATAGVGTNLFLCKIALDITAKHADDHIGVLDDESFRQKIWHHRPITDIWGIGHGTARRLAALGVYDLHGITQLPESCLYKAFGVNAQYLIDHAYGRESSTLGQIHAYKPKNTSLSNSQILFSDYSRDNAYVVLREMVDALVLKLVEQNQLTHGVSLFVGYSKDSDPSGGGSHRFEKPTDSFRIIMAAFDSIYRRTVLDKPIRRVGIAFQELSSGDNRQLSLFDDLPAQQKERDLQLSRIFIKNKFGKNAVLKGLSYTEAGTARTRNKLIGGHNGG